MHQQPFWNTTAITITGGFLTTHACRIAPRAGQEADFPGRVLMYLKPFIFPVYKLMELKNVLRVEIESSFLTLTRKFETFLSKMVPAKMFEVKTFRHSQ